jgi:hypothetical protein
VKKNIALLYDPIVAFLIDATSERWSESTALCVWGADGLAALAVLTGAQRRPVVGSRSPAA